MHIAARVMTAARSGQLLATRTVRDLVVGSDIAMDELGTRSLKASTAPGNYSRPDRDGMARGSEARSQVVQPVRCSPADEASAGSRLSSSRP